VLSFPAPAHWEAACWRKADSISVTQSARRPQRRVPDQRERGVNASGLNSWMCERVYMDAVRGLIGFEKTRVGCFTTGKRRRPLSARNRARAPTRNRFPANHGNLALRSRASLSGKPRALFDPTKRPAKVAQSCNRARVTLPGHHAVLENAPPRRRSSTVCRI
jgi:hypothetical protein